MWSTKPARSASLLLMLAAALAGCSTGGRVGPRGALPEVVNAPTPLDQYAIKVAPQDEQVALAPHAFGLSQAQRAALADFAARWREAGTETVTIDAPSVAACGCDPHATARAALAALQGLGVPPSLLKIGEYDPAGRPNAPVLAHYARFVASTDDCSKRWSNLVSTADNTVTSHFACATTQNIAAMVADPHDFLRPAPTTPADNGRRAVVLDKYRQGQITSSVKDDQASGTVSQAVH